MRRTSIAVFLLILVVSAAFGQAVSSAPGSVTAPQPILSVTPTNRPVSANAGTTTFAVDNAGNGAMHWTATSSDAWAIITPPGSGTNAGSITVSFTENTTGAPRVASITVTAPDALSSPQTVTITQAVAQPILSVTPADRAVEPAAGTVTFAVTNTGTGTMPWAASSAEAWVTISSGSSGTDSGTITVDYTANASTSPRVATITVTAQGATGSPQSVTISQSGAQPVLAVSPADSAVAAAAGTATFDVANTGTGTMAWTAASSETWALITGGSSGTDAGTVTVDYAANPTNIQRVATITVTAAGATGSPQSVTLTQAAGQPVLSVSPADSAVTAGGGSATFSVANTGTGTLSWTAVSSDGWANISSGSSGTDAGTITVDCSANTTLAQRVATVTVTSPEATGSPIPVTITQAAGVTVLSVTPSDTAVSAVAGSAVFSVSNDGAPGMAWSAVSDSAWATLSSGSSGTDAGAVTVDYQANRTNSPRVATITVTAPGATGNPKQVRITQAAGEPALSVSPSDSSIGSAAGTATFSVTNAGTGTLAWTASSDSAWATITSGSSGTDAGMITVSYTENAGPLQRSATITVTATGGLSQKVTITQAPGIISGVELLSGIPEQYVLAQNYPNPFNPSTTIRFGLPVAAQVRLEVFNILGQKVGSIANGMMGAGYHVVSFDGSSLSSGAYLYRLQAGTFVAVKRFVLQK